MSAKPLIAMSSLLPGREVVMPMRPATPSPTHCVVTRAADAKDPPMATAPEKIVAHLTEIQRWTSKKALAKVCGLHGTTIVAGLAALSKDGKVQRRGRGRATEWAIAGLAGRDEPRSVAAAADALKTEKRKEAPEGKRRKPPKFRRGRRPNTAKIPLGARKLPNGSPSFGYFSDGSLLIDCVKCKGTLTQEDLRALRDFTARFESQRT